MLKSIYEIIYNRSVLDNPINFDDSATSATIYKLYIQEDRCYHYIDIKDGYCIDCNNWNHKHVGMLGYDISP